MRMSTRAQYAVRAMVDLSLYSGGKPVSMKEIAKREEIPLDYLEQLFHRLKKGKILKAVRGPSGGYLLARESTEIKIGEIVELVEEPLNLVTCLDDGGVNCSRTASCVTQSVWKELGDMIRVFLDSKSLEDLTRQARGKIRGEA